MRAAVAVLAASAAAGVNAQGAVIRINGVNGDALEGGSTTSSSLLPDIQGGPRPIPMDDTTTTTTSGSSSTQSSISRLILEPGPVIVTTDIGRFARDVDTSSSSSSSSTSKHKLITRAKVSSEPTRTGTTKAGTLTTSTTTKPKLVTDASPTENNFALSAVLRFIEECAAAASDAPVERSTTVIFITTTTTVTATKHRLGQNSRGLPARPPHFTGGPSKPFSFDPIATPTTTTRAKSL